MRTTRLYIVSPLHFPIQKFMAAKVTCNAEKRWELDNRSYAVVTSSSTGSSAALSFKQVQNWFPQNVNAPSVYDQYGSPSGFQ